MSIQSELSAQIYRLEELHNNFSNGEHEEMNALYSDEFQGFLYTPSTGKVEMYDAEQIRKGNKDAADYYKGKDIKFVYSGLSIIPQSEDQAAVSYEITYIHHTKIVIGTSLEVWKKIDGVWKLIRWYEEKGNIVS